MKKLFIDLGHSIRFPGASGIKTEVAWNRAIWSSLKPKIDTKKWQIMEVPTDYLTDWSANRQLVNRISWINKYGSEKDWLLSIHGNAASNPKVRGVTTCYMGGSNAACKESKALSLAYSKGTGVPVWAGGAFDDRDGRFGRIGMVRDTEPFALLIEAGFVTNKADMAISPDVAASAIAGYFNSV